MKRKKMLWSTLACILFAVFCLTAPALAMGERTFDYDTGIRLNFGLGYGKKAVRDEAFSEFAREVVTPTFKDGYCSFTALGEWVHPERGLIRERNVVLLLDLKAGPELEAKCKHVAEEFLKRFPGSNASVYVVLTPGIQAKIFYQD